MWGSTSSPSRMGFKRKDKKEKDRVTVCWPCTNDTHPKEACISRTEKKPCICICSAKVR